jgi:hypothetical protein
MTPTHTSDNIGQALPDQAPDSQAVLDEVIDTSLHPDRAHHDELGRTEESVSSGSQPEEAPPSPREQPAVPLDIQRIDE